MTIDTSTAPGREPDPAAVDHLAEPSLAELARADGVRFLLAMFVDLTGKPCAKLVPVESADELQYEGVGFAGYAVGAIGQQPSDPDLIAVPDLASYTPAALGAPGPGPGALRPARRGRALALRAAGDPASGCWRRRGGRAGSSCSRAPRSSTSSSPATPTATLRPGRRPDDAAQPCYDARGLTRMYDHLTGVSTAMNALGWGNYANDHEDANGQFEQNFAYADALTTADRVITARYLISVLAEQRGHDRDVHAQAVRRPHRLGDAPAPLAVARRHLPLSPTRTTPAASGSPSWRTGSSAASSTTRTGCRPSSRRRSTPTSAPGPRSTRSGRDVVAAPAELRRQRPHPLRPRPRRRPHRAARRRRRGQPLPGPRRGARRRARRDRPRASIRAPRARRARAPSSRPRCCTPWTPSPPTRSSPAPSTPPARASRQYFADAQARGVPRLARHGRLLGASTATSPRSRRPDRAQPRRREEPPSCAASSDSTCATRSCTRSSGACWRRCCAGSPSAAPTRRASRVYGDRAPLPGGPRRGLGARLPAGRPTCDAVPRRRDGCASSPLRRRHHGRRGPDRDRRAGRRAVRAAVPTARRRRLGPDLAVYKGTGAPARPRRDLRPGRARPAGRASRTPGWPPSPR